MNQHRTTPPAAWGEWLAAFANQRRYGARTPIEARDQTNKWAACGGLTMPDANECRWFAKANTALIRQTWGG